MSEMAAAGGVIFLLYKRSEAKSIKAAEAHLIASGIVAIECNNPANFKFVIPTRIVPQFSDAVGRAALRAIGTGSYASSAYESFTEFLRAELLPAESTSAANSRAPQSKKES